ncbi:aldo/keto reductase [Blautia massiliensis (ex Durand et al. 2017)]|uniref:aldo/keto reductase n=1 Tax=Blautia massiliensis (ex Durand et al. 2017) TaxID=1737424 RepID=UPI000A561CCA
MEYGKLGNTDIEVSKLCVGCMSFGKAGTMHDWTLDEAESENVIKHALDLGYNFFDTANGYSAGTSEEYLGKALKKNVARNQVVIASKVYFNEGRLSRQAIMREIDGTLSRLGTDYLDLYIIHRFDYDTPIEETMEALHDLVKAGKVRALGASAMYALCLAAKRGVDVRIITPGIPDKKFIYNITRSFYHGLVKHGVRVYEWTPGFCHAKMSVADDCMATCGTINLDYRSLYHHFENGCFMADCQAVVEIKNDLIRTMGECRDVTDQYQTGRSAYLRLGQLFMRLFAGLL